MVVAGQEVSARRPIEGVDEGVRRGGDQSLQPGGRVKSQLRDRFEIRVQRLVCNVLRRDDRVVVRGPLAGEQVLPTLGLPAIPKAGVRQPRRHRPTLAEIDAELGRSQRRREAGKPPPWTRRWLAGGFGPSSRLLIGVRFRSAARPGDVPQAIESRRKVAS